MASRATPDGMAEGYPSRKRTSRLTHVPQELVARLEQRRASGRGLAVMVNLGISDNTWRKIRTGMPIRASVADRLRRHLSEEPA